MALHYFNPGHESAVLNASPYYTPPANPAKMQEDLAYLPAWYAHSKDYVFVKERLSEDFSQSVKALSKLPEAIIADDFSKRNFSVIGEAIPWGISPQSIHFFEYLNQKYNLNLALPSWSETLHRLCSRLTAKECLESVVRTVSDISSSIIPKFYSDLNAIIQEVDAQKKPLLIKTPYSSSGRGLLWVHSGLHRPEQQILRGMLKKQTVVSLEKVLDKHLDFSAQFFSDENGTIRFEGFSIFRTNSKGAYEGSNIQSPKETENQLYSFLDKSLIDRVKKSIMSFLTTQVSSSYRGCIGVDMMIYKENGILCFHPCVEINLRFNMGWMAINLHKNHIKEDAQGVFQIACYPESGKACQKHLEMRKNHPLTMKNFRIESGYLSLCPVSEKNNFLAFILIRKKQEEPV